MRPESANDLHRHFPDFDAFWNHDDFFATENSIKALLAEPSAARAELLTQLARLQGLQGRLDLARVTMDEAKLALDEAWGVDAARARIRWDLEQGRWLLLSRFPARATPHFAQAYQSARTEGLSFFAIDAAAMISISQPLKNRKEWLEQALEMAEAATDEKPRSWLPQLHLMSGWVAFDLHRFDEALAHFDRALADPRRAHDGPRILQWSRGRVLRALGRNEEALQVQRDLRNDLASLGDGNGHVDLEIAECLQALGRLEESRAAFAAAYELLSKDQYYSDNHPSELDRIQKRSKNK